VWLASTAGGLAEQTRWRLQCDRWSRLYHPAIARLVDYGIVGETAPFEASRGLSGKFVSLLSGRRLLASLKSQVSSLKSQGVRPASRGRLSNWSDPERNPVLDSAVFAVPPRER